MTTTNVTDPHLRGVFLTPNLECIRPMVEQLQLLVGHPTWAYWRQTPPNSPVCDSVWLTSNQRYMQWQPDPDSSSADLPAPNPPFISPPPHGPASGRGLLLSRGGRGRVWANAGRGQGGEGGGKGVPHDEPETSGRTFPSQSIDRYHEQRGRAFETGGLGGGGINGRVDDQENGSRSREPTPGAARATVAVAVASAYTGPLFA